MQSLLLLLPFLWLERSHGAFSQGAESDYLANFNAINAASYAAVDDPNSGVPPDLVSQCKKSNTSGNGITSTTITITKDGTGNDGTVDSQTVGQNCSPSVTCIISNDVTLLMKTNLNVGSLIVRGRVVWNDETQINKNAFLCAGYVAIEGQGTWDMHLEEKNAWVYIKDNGATHPTLRSCAFGGVATAEDTSDTHYPTIDIRGRELKRTWSLLSETLGKGDIKMKLMHDPTLMGWFVGDCIAAALTEDKAKAFGEEFCIVAFEYDGTIVLNRSVTTERFEATFLPPISTAGGGSGVPALKSAEVINLDRNIVITGDDFSQVGCDPNLPEAVAGEQTSVLGCRCSSFRCTCTVGLHTIQMFAGVSRIQHTRIEKCGQRGVEGKYCLHLHKMKACPTCLYHGNAIENSHQRGIIIHSTHLSTVQENTLYNVRGAGIYLEDGNEMQNYVKYNVVICPFPFRHPNLGGCTIPGTSNSVADTSDNQSGLFSRAATNDFTGNRVANCFNGMFLLAGSIGRGESYNRVCEQDVKIGRVEGNTFHGNGRFGTYTLGGNYPKVTVDQSIATNGWNVDKEGCQGFDSSGQTRGLPSAFKDNMDYHNAFVGHYEAGDIQYNGHLSFDSNNLLYWKETKKFENGCSAHVTKSHFANGNMALPDQGTFIIEDTTFGDNVSLEPNHHCNVGRTGLLCMPQYVLHRVNWKNKNRSRKWVEFQHHNAQPHSANQVYGGVFTLSPDDAAVVMNGRDLDGPIFPSGFVSLVSSKFNYLLSVPENLCVMSRSLGSEYGLLYDDGILCKVPLRTLKIYSRGLVSGSAPALRVDAWFQGGGSQSGPPNTSQNIGFHQVGEDYKTRKQGYSLPVIPGLNHSYRLSLVTADGNIPRDWVVEFSDVVIGNRWNIEFLHLTLQGRRNCGRDGTGLISSHHDRSFIWSGDTFMDDAAWGQYGACVDSSNPPVDSPRIECSLKMYNNGVLPATECPELCDTTCNPTNSYCDCGSKTCHCKPGFTGPNCSVDLCAAARCSDNGTCTARYLGNDASLPVTSRKTACICDQGWTGHLCQYNPCQEQGLTCSGHGTCVASSLSSQKAVCECDPGYSGQNCDVSCHDVCQGNYPFNCATNLDGVVKYGCHSSGACHYLKEGEEYPFSGFCTFKSVDDGGDTSCQCESRSECEVVGPCRPDGSCPEPTPLADNTPCHSVPFGVCETGVCVGTKMPPSSPVPSSPSPPTIFTSVPTPSPTPVSDLPPSMNFICGCKDCNDDILNTMAGDYSCGARINWLQSGAGGSHTEEAACIKVARDEFSSICGPMCDPTRCKSTSASPTTLPSAHPTAESSNIPTNYPTNDPTDRPTRKKSPPPSSNNPPSSTTHPCGCQDCTKNILNNMAGDYSCGARINWLQSLSGGSHTEKAACIIVARDEFPSICGPMCDPTRCQNSNAPSMMPSRYPSVTSPVSYPCGCQYCTENVLNTMAGDYSCGARIHWLRSTAGGSLTEKEACVKVSRDEFNGICGPMCDPTRCQTINKRYLRT